jgi:hypothetical protein
MNERIKELAEQARGQMVRATTVDSDDLWDDHLDFCEKFAELIVRECAEICLSDDSMRILNYFEVSHE